MRYKGITLLIALNVSRRIEDLPLSNGGVERGVQARPATLEVMLKLC